MATSDNTSIINTSQNTIVFARPLVLRMRRPDGRDLYAVYNRRPAQRWISLSSETVMPSTCFLVSPTRCRPGNVAVYVKTAPAFLWKPEFQRIFQYVIESNSIKHVILTMYWKAYLADVPEGSSLDKEISLVI